MPSPRSDPERGQRRPPADDFEWPPRDELWVHDVDTGRWRVQQTASDDAAVAERPDPPTLAPLDSSSMDERTGDRLTPWLRSTLVAAALVAMAAAWVLYHGVSAPVPAEAAPPPVVVTVVPAVPNAGADAAPPPPLTIRATWPEKRPGLDGAPGATADPAPPVSAMPGVVAPSIATSSTMVSRTDAVEAVGGGAPLPAAPEARSADAVVSPEAATPTGAVTNTTTAALAPAALIQGVLDRYEDAYDRRDVDSAASLWPSLDRRALARAFASLDRQDVEFDRCDIDVAGTRGSAVCVGTVRYVPSVGRGVEKAGRITWTFDLARAGDDWRIAGLHAR